MLNRLQGVFASLHKHNVKIDVQTSTPGLHFEQAWQNKELMSYQGQEFYIVSQEDLIASKRAAGRDIDLEDARLLELKNDTENP